MTTHNAPTAIVTGGGTGIGLATVRRLLADGCNVVVASRDEGDTGALAAEFGTERVVFIRTDVTDEAAVASMVSSTLERFGHIDFLFNNAGTEGAVGPMAAWSADDVDRVLDVNVKGVFLCTKHAAPVMNAGSVIVNASSILGTIPMPVAAPYAASKAAVLSLTVSAAAELAERGVDVLAICPGVVDTPMMDRVSKAAGAPMEALARSICPSGRVISPDRVASVVADLFSGSLQLETGSAIRVAPESVEPITIAFTHERAAASVT
jgi:NAD(P)-dependent dehydrogenase (short-subunit alcohol dehydrogenase family)